MAMSLPSGTTASQRLLFPSSITASQRWKTAKYRMILVTHGKKYSTKTVSCSIPAIQQAQESNAREGLTVTTNQHAGAHFSPVEALTDNKPHSKSFKITSAKNGENLFKKFENVQQFVQLILVYEILFGAETLDHPAAVPVNILLTVIVLGPDSDGIKAIIDRLMRSSNYSKGLLLLLLFSSSGIKGVNAQDDGEDGILKNTNESACILWTFLVGVISITVFAWIIRRMRAAPQPAALPAIPPLGLGNMLTSEPVAPRRSDVQFQIPERFEDMEVYLPDELFA